jgi:DNA-binding response OmpR family regulator
VCLAATPRPKVALLCPEPRLRRVLTLALEADGLDVLGWPDPNSSLAETPAIVIADLDSLGWDPISAIHRLLNVRIAYTTPLLLISVYPHVLENVGRTVRLLQPPFAWDELTRRVRCLLGLGTHL